MNQLKIKIDLEDYTAGLSGIFEANGFSGFGEGWFNHKDIIEFSRSLETLANIMNGEAELIGGESKSDGSEYLECFGLRCYVISKTGIIGVHVTLSDRPYTDCRVKEILKVSGELRVEKQLALTFAQELHDLCLGQVSEVLLVGSQ